MRPTRRSDSRPPSTTSTVGRPTIPYRRETAGCSSTFSRPTFRRPWNGALAAASAVAMIAQGTHQSAQNVTATGSADRSTASSQPCSVKVSRFLAEVELDELDQVLLGEEADPLLGHLPPLEDHEGGQ